MREERKRLSIMRLIQRPGRTVGGEVTFNGQDLLALDDSAMRRIRGKDMAMIFQEPMTSLNPVLTIGKQLTEALVLHLGLDQNAANNRAGELLEMVGIPEGAGRLADYPHQFSGGMRQRVMIAMALSCDPKMLIADEPTTALDVTIQAQILELVKKLGEETGTAVLIITHNLGVVARYADRVNVMYAGKIIERGTAGRYTPTRGILIPLGCSTRCRVWTSLAKSSWLRLRVSPDLIGLPIGCAFRPRCKYAIDRCAVEYPPLIEVTEGHTAACWVSDQLGRQEVR